jgi:ABC-type transport system involved in cytochrome c biogenesis permease component
MIINWLHTLSTLILKETRIELRGKELLTLLLSATLITGAIIGAGVSQALLDSTATSRIYPALVWIVYLITTTTASVRISETELEGRGFEGLLLAGASGAQIYLSKVVVTTLLFWINWIALITVCALVLNQDLKGALLQLAAIGFASAGAISALVVLTAAVAATAKLRGVLLPIVTLPLLFPVFFAGLELTTDVVLAGSVNEGGIWPSIIFISWFGFLLIGINCYEEVVKG